MINSICQYCRLANTLCQTAIHTNALSPYQPDEQESTLPACRDASGYLKNPRAFMRSQPFQRGVGKVLPCSLARSVMVL